MEQSIGEKVFHALARVKEHPGSEITLTPASYWHFAHYWATHQNEAPKGLDPDGGVWPIVIGIRDVLTLPRDAGGCEEVSL